jgi:hypothetical protein
MPLTDAPAAARRPTTIAIASSSSSNSGGIAVPAQPIAAGRASERLDWIAELAQPLDVPTDRAGRYRESLAQLIARPIAAALQQGEQLQ